MTDRHKFTSKAMSVSRAPALSSHSATASSNVVKKRTVGGISGGKRVAADGGQSHDSRRTGEFVTKSEGHQDNQWTSPFVKQILDEKVVGKQKWPTFDLYWGLTDPRVHLRNFEDSLELHCDISDAIKCRLFLTTLKDEARTWLENLPEGSVSSFPDLRSLFLGNYSSLIQPQERSTTLLTVKQGLGEPLRNYITRFNQVLSSLRGVSLDVTVFALSAGLRSGNLLNSFRCRAVVSHEDLYERIQRYINIESDCVEVKQSEVRLDGSGVSLQYNRSQVYYASQRHQNIGEKRRKSIIHKNAALKSARRIDLPPMLASFSHVLATIKDKRFYKKPPKMTSAYQVRNTERYCFYHEQNGHNTEDCFKLKELFKKLIDQGHLDQFLEYQYRRGSQPFLALQNSVGL